LYAGLCLTGLSGGLLEAPVITTVHLSKFQFKRFSISTSFQVLTYVAEVTTPKVRGMLSATGSFCVILGVFIVFLLGLFFQWRTIALYSCVLPLSAFVLLFLVPESPHWLIRKNRLEEAKRNLAWLRGWVPVKKVPKHSTNIIYKPINQYSL
jgi:MFS family permease